MAVKKGRRGMFLACTAFPECKSTLDLKEVLDGRAIAADPLPETDEVCEKCGTPMVVKNSRRGPFIACPAFPKCRNAKPIAEIKDGKAIPGKPKAGTRSSRTAPVQTDIACENCDKPMLLREGRKGWFLGCSGYPKCKTIVDATPEIVEKWKQKEEAAEPDTSAATEKS